MSLSDPLGDMLTRIRNGQAAQKAMVSSPASKLRVSVLEVLCREGYIRSYNRDEGPQGALSIELKYHNGAPVIRQLKRVSRPGRRVYSAVKDLPRVMRLPGTLHVKDPARPVLVTFKRQSGAHNRSGKALLEILGVTADRPVVVNDQARGGEFLVADRDRLRRPSR